MTYLKKQLSPFDEALLQATVLAHFPRLADHPVCDFCGNDDPEWIYAASRSSIGKTEQVWRWMACATCDNFIGQGRWTELEVRVEAALENLLTGRNVNIPKSSYRAWVKKSLEEFHRYSVKI